jgi:hypothetical protein
MDTVDAAGGDLSKFGAACKRFDELEGYLYSKIKSLSDYGRACRHHPDSRIAPTSAGVSPWM